MTEPADIPIQYVKSVGPARAGLLVHLGVETAEDLLYLFPRRYEDRRKLTPMALVKRGEMQTVTGVISAAGARRTYFNKMPIFEIIAGDETGRVKCVWFNQPYLANIFQAGAQVVLHGRVEWFKDHFQITNPEYEIIDQSDVSLSMGRIVPIYPLTKGISQRYLRKLIFSCLQNYADALPDVIPPLIRARQGLGLLAEAIRDIHFPPDNESRSRADRRVSFEEFFLFQISVILRRSVMAGQGGCRHVISARLQEGFARAFPFQLTGDQLKAIHEMAVDMQKPHPMLRLLQGDVGCGKTVVSFYGCLAAVANGYQAAIMAPTEILAEQHYTSFTRYFADGPAGLLRVALLKSALKKKERAVLLKKIKAGEIDVVVGTHALISDEVEFKALSFVCVDEQHKFGVKQRALLSSKGLPPDVLVMTATPIPRSLCLTLYGDLDVSVISERPAGRGDIKTYHVAEDQADAVYKRVAEWVAKGTQAYIVYPVIEESEKEDLKAAVRMFERFTERDFHRFKVGLMHGRLKRDEAGAVMERFKRHEIDILVTTTVLEVGIDVPNANVMVIENAQRFGLAQLHQLRGRIGRGEKHAVCILLATPRTEEGERRIKALLRTTDGFAIAQEDLALRGPGQYFGRQQHGLNELKVVNPLTQIDVLEAARLEAADLLRADHCLEKNPVILATIRRRYPEYLECFMAG